MTLHLSLSPDLESKLRARAAASGKEISDYVLEAVEEKLKAPEAISTDDLQERVAKASLSQAELLQLARQSNSSWKDAWMKEPDPFTPL